MVDMYQTGIIITIILIIAGSMFGVLIRIDDEDDGINFAIPTTFNSISTPGSNQNDLNSLITQINSDFNTASSSSTLVSQTILFGLALVNGAITMANVIVAAFTSWFAIVDLLFAFTLGTPMEALKYPIKIVLSLVILYTIIKFLGDMVSHLPFFGG